jgi:hypothetical protein
VRTYIFTDPSFGEYNSRWIKQAEQSEAPLPIYSVAIKTSDEYVNTPGRSGGNHSDLIRIICGTDYVDESGESRRYDYFDEKDKWIEGFVDHLGNFYNRREALAVVIKFDQIHPDFLQDGYLSQLQSYMVGFRKEA